MTAMAAKGAQVNVLYPRQEGASFDLSYYITTHMPLVVKHWTKHGLKSYSITQMTPDSPYSLSCLTEWESVAGRDRAMQDPLTKELMDDIPNYTAIKPIFLVGEIVDRSP